MCLGDSITAGYTDNPDQELWDYNLFIRDDLVPTYAAHGYGVSTADLYSLFLTDAEDPASITPSGHSNKINHPSPDLYTRIAQTWFDGMKLALEKRTHCNTGDSE